MTRRFYHQQQRNQQQYSGGEDDPLDPPGGGGLGGGPPPPPQPPPPQSTWFKTTLQIAFGAVVGAVAVDLYRRVFSNKTKNPDDDDMMMGNGQFSSMGAMPGAPSIMPMPLPLPMPFPMPMPMGGYGGGYGPPPGWRDERPLTDNSKLELARIELEKAKADERRAHWEAFMDDEE
jgi:hypothetical protein